MLETNGPCYYYYGPMANALGGVISIYVLNHYHMDAASVIFVITKASNRQPPEFGKHDCFELEHMIRKVRYRSKLCYSREIYKLTFFFGHGE